VGAWVVQTFVWGETIYGLTASRTSASMKRSSPPMAGNLISRMRRYWRSDWGSIWRGLKQIITS